MENSKNFDLMKNKPVLDRDTLNYVYNNKYSIIFISVEPMEGE